MTYFSDSVEAGYQSEDPADLEIAQKVRLRLANADRLSFEAEGVRVGAFDRVVTLSGDVPSADEKRLIEALAGGVAGVRNVHNEITVYGK